MRETKSFKPLGLAHQLLIGKPIATAHAHAERLGPLLGLPVFSSDALSSVAYATEAILTILVLANPNIHALRFQFPISIVICLLIWIVAISYRQTIHAYPTGGGSYIVASDNLGESAGLLAGASLLVDYVLTVSVSVAAGVAAIVSAYPFLHPWLVPISILCILIVMWANLRGVRESGAMFAVPTYAFIVGMLGLLAFGIFKALGSPPVHQIVTADLGGRSLIGKDINVAFLFLVLRAFAAGCTALTGIEAVSNGVQAFKAPEAKNAATTLTAMATLLTLMFIGLGYMVQHMPNLILYDSSSTVVSQIAAWTFGNGSRAFYFIQYATAAILILAANTAFADFPRLASIISRDGYLPRSLSRQGDRLVFHNGIMLLAFFACILVWYFHGELDALLPLYAVGVFTAFTLSQLGMVTHWFRLKNIGWKRRAVVNGIGAVSTLIVAIIILVTKFMEGAWIVALLLPIQFAVFKFVKSRYRDISTQMAVGGRLPPKPSENVVLLLVPRVHRGILAALNYALLTGFDCRAVHVAINNRALPEILHQWETFGEGVALVVLKSPYRSLIDPVLEYIDTLQEEKPDGVVTVIVPESVGTKWYHKLLQENVASQLKRALGSRRNVVVTNVRYFLD